jgi:MFS transporter, SP family, xylose:H+ symportor
MNNRSFLLRSTVIAALGGLLFGFDAVVINGTTDALRRVYHLGDFALGFTVASALIGTILGSILVGRPADRFGRRAVLLSVAVIYVVSSIGTALAWNWLSFLVFRFLGGLGIGAASVASPMYIAEISPAKYRGRLVAVTQFNIVFGILLAYLSNYVIAQLGLGENDWRWMFGVMAFPSAAFFGLLFLTPLGPRWLVSKNRIDEARAELGLLGADSDSIDKEIQDIQASLDLSHHSLLDPFFSKTYLKPILLVVAIAMFNQLSGINALLFYATSIFQMAGAGKDAALLQGVAVGAMNMIVTMAAMALIDHFGRRKLMIVGSIGYILSLATIAWAFYAYSAEFHRAMDAAETVAKAKTAADTAAIASAESSLAGATAAARSGSAVVLVSLMVFIASHAFGQGAVIWVFISEIFPNRVRARGQALGSFTHWLMCALIAWTFPVIAEASGGYAFAFYAAMMVLQLLWALWIMPETKGVSLEEIQKKLGIA